MKIRKLWIAPLLILPLGAIAYSQETKQDPKPEAKATEASAATDDPMMKKMMELGTPGEAHRVLDNKVGKWNVKMKMMMPGQAPMESTCTTEVAWILDGHYLQEKSKGEFMGQPSEMIAFVGYDNLKKKYFWSGVCNNSTGMCVAEGTYDAAKKTFTYTGQQPDATMTKYVTGRWVEKWTDNDHATIQNFMPGPDGKEVLACEMTYTRAGADKSANAK